MDILLVAARIFIAAFLGALIGTEREKKQGSRFQNTYYRERRCVFNYAYSNRWSK